MVDPTIPSWLQDLVWEELEPGEEILWLGTPRPVFLTCGTFAALLFGVPLTALAVNWLVSSMREAGAAQAGGAPLDWLMAWGMPLILLLIGLAILVVPIREYRQSLRTVFLVTDRRAISFEASGRSTTIRSYSRKEMGKVYRRQKRDGSGDIIIGPRTFGDYDDGLPMGFFRIRDVREVERLVKGLAAGEETGPEAE